MPGKSFIGSELFPKVANLVGVLENSRKDAKMVEGGDPALLLIHAGTKLTVHRALPYGCGSSWLEPEKITTFV